MSYGDSSAVERQYMKPTALSIRPPGADLHTTFGPPQPFTTKEAMWATMPELVPPRRGRDDSKDEACLSGGRPAWDSTKQRSMLQSTLTPTLPRSR